MNFAQTFILNQLLGNQEDGEDDETATVTTAESSQLITTDEEQSTSTMTTGSLISEIRTSSISEIRTSSSDGSRPREDFSGGSRTILSSHMQSSAQEGMLSISSAAFSAGTCSSRNRGRDDDSFINGGEAASADYDDMSSLSSVGSDTTDSTGAPDHINRNSWFRWMPRLEIEAAEESRQQSIASSLSLHPSMLDSSLADIDSNIDDRSSARSDHATGDNSQSGNVLDYCKPDWPAESTGHHPGTFRDVGSSLLVPGREERTHQSNSSIQENSSGSWWTTLSEKDWEGITAAAQSVLDSMDVDGQCSKDPNRSLVISPTSPPPADINSVCRPFFPLDEETEGKIDTALPKEFICPLCNKLLVGAIIFGCGCSRNTCCLSCIERESKQSAEKDTAVAVKKDVIVEDDFVLIANSSDAPCAMNGWKPRRSSHPSHTNIQCPSCAKSVVVACHALDVAILNAVKNLSSLQSGDATNWKDEDLISYQQNYYQRLRVWGEEVLTRRKLFAEKEEFRRQEVVAKMLEAEEELFWAKEKKRTGPKCYQSFARRHRLNFSDVGIFVAAAVGTSILVNMIRKR